MKPLTVYGWLGKGHLPALLRRSLEPGNYTSAEFAGELRELGILQSVGRTGICFDNALAESVNGTLKVELIYRTAYPTREKAQDDIARWIELRYNRTRLHSALSYRTPQEVMDEYLNGQKAA